MMKEAPEVSVVIPLYNKAEFILNTLASVAKQTHCDLEIIIVDDGSTDASANLVESVGIPKLQLIRQHNAGVSTARNQGIAAARGKWIAFLDADDLWAPDHLATLLSAVASSETTAAFSNVRLQSRAGQPLIDRKITPQKVSDYFSFALANGGYPVTSSSIIVLRSELIAAGLFAEGIAIGEDVDMWCRLALRGSFFYTANISATYNDASSPTLRSRTGGIVRPLFAQRVVAMSKDRILTEPLAESSNRYSNFLMLEYARQLLDADRYAEARRILLDECIPSYDWKRFLKRLSRTSPLGQTLFRLVQSAGRS